MTLQNEKMLKTMAYAVISLCSVTVFGRASQTCAQAASAPAAAAEAAAADAGGLGAIGTGLGALFGGPAGGPAGGCKSHMKGVIALGVIAFIISVAMVVLWFIAEELASKICLPLSNLLFACLAVGVALAFQSGPVQDTVFFLALVVALLTAVYNWNRASFSIKLVSEVKAPTTVDAPPSFQAEQP